MDEQPIRPKTRFERRKVEIPSGDDQAYEFAVADSVTATGSSPVVWLLLVLISGLLGVIGYGYPELQKRVAEVGRLEQRLTSENSGIDRELADARAEISALRSDLANREAGQVEDRFVLLESERDAAISSLSAARQRIAALQAELGAPATGRAEIGEFTSVNPEADQAQRLESMMLEVRLLARERDAARQQIDQMLKRQATLDQDLEQTESVEASAVERELDELRTAHAELQSQLERRISRIERQERELEEVKDALSVVEAERGAALSSVQDLERQIDDLTQQLEESHIEIEGSNTEANQLLEAQEAKFDDLSTRLSQIEEELGTAVEERAIVEAERDDALLRISELEAQRRDAQIKADASQAAVEKLQIEVSNAGLLAGELAEMKSANAVLNAGLSQAEEQVSALERERDEIAQELAALKQSSIDGAGLAEEFEAELTSAQARVTSLQSELASAIEGQTQQAEQNGRLSEEAEVARRSLSEAEADIEALRQELDVTRAKISELENIDAEPAQPTPAESETSTELTAELEQLKGRVAFFERFLTRFTPSPPVPAPR